MIHKFETTDGKPAGIDLSKVVSIRATSGGWYQVRLSTPDEKGYEIENFQMNDDKAKKLIEAWEGLKSFKY